MVYLKKFNPCIIVRRYQIKKI